MSNNGTDLPDDYELYLAYPLKPNQVGFVLISKI